MSDKGLDLVVLYPKDRTDWHAALRRRTFPIAGDPIAFRQHATVWIAWRNHLVAAFELASVDARGGKSVITKVPGSERHLPTPIPLKDIPDPHHARSFWGRWEEFDFRYLRPGAKQFVSRRHEAGEAPRPPSFSNKPRVDLYLIDDRRADGALDRSAGVEPVQQRAAQALLRRFRHWCGNDEVLRRHRIQTGDGDVIWTDCFLPKRHLVVAVKGSADRASARMALGQLIDYRRYLTPNIRGAILMPSWPGDDVAALVKAGQAKLIWENEDGEFVDASGTAPW